MKDQSIHKIDSISSTMCLAKWLQCTIDLHNGLTHSCHHPVRHKIPLENIESNPSVLHNTKYKIEMRQEMLNGIRPSECHYCWNVEDLEENVKNSDRYIKSSEAWAMPYFDDILKSPLDDKIAPKYLEVMFDNTCNLSCAYCMGSISSSIENEIEQFGPIMVRDSQHRIGPKGNKSSGYRKAFWKWIPEIIDSLHYLRITGGEPFLSPSLIRLYDELECLHSAGNMTLAINSNLSLPKSLVLKHVKKIKNLLNKHKISHVEFYVSVDTVDHQAEYIRSGLNFNLFWENLIFLLEEFKSQKIIIMSTFQIFSLPRFKDLLSLVSDTKKIHPNLLFDIAYLQDPQYLKAEILGEYANSFLAKILNYINNGPNNFSSYECMKINRTLSLAQRTMKEEMLFSLQIDFFKFVSEFDKRKDTSFLSTFPEFDEFWKKTLGNKV